MNLFTKQKHRLREQNRGDQGEGQGGTDWEFGIEVYKLLYFKWINNKNLLYSTENSAQYSVII